MASELAAVPEDDVKLALADFWSEFSTLSTAGWR